MMYRYLKFLAKFTFLAILAIGLSIFGYVIVIKKPWFSDFDAHALLKKYSQEEIDHFASFAFQKRNTLKKWEENIYVRMDSLASQDKKIKKTTLECIDRLNNLMDQVEIEFYNEHPNVRIMKVDSISYLVRGRTSRKINYLRVPYPSLNESEILLMTEHKLSGPMSEEDVYALICHEFSHLLGFDHNFKFRDPDPSPLNLDYRR